MKTQNHIIIKLNTYKKIIRTIWYIILGISILITICVPTLMVLSQSSSLPLERLVFQFTAPGLKINLDSNIFQGSLTPFLVSMAINIFTICFLLLYSVYQFLKIFESFIENNTSFIMENIYRMKRISYSFFLYSIIIFATGVILKLLFIQNSSIASFNGIQININASIPSWSIVCGIFLLGFAEIFSYGVKLQQDNNSII